MNRVAVYDPFDAVFPSLLRGFFQPVTVARDAIDIRMDVIEAAGEYVVQAEMPGVSKEDIQVQIDGNKVRIAAEVKRVSDRKAEPAVVSENTGDSAEKAGAEKTSAAAERVLRSERYYGAMARSFAMAVEIDEERSSAKFENGVLTLTLPKKVALPAKRLAIH